jgi:protein Tex
MDVIQRIAEELSVNSRQVSAAVSLLDEGATVPFIARYRKEATGGLDDGQLRLLEERLTYLRELNERRKTILDSIGSQGKLTPELEKAIREADTKTLLEDLYLPYKPKRRTKAQIAREAGLEPLADALLDDRGLIPEQIAAGYIDADKGVPDRAAALEGARQIIMERISEDAELLAELRERTWQKGILHATVVKDKEREAAKFLTCPSRPMPGWPKPPAWPGKSSCSRASTWI